MSKMLLTETIPVVFSIIEETSLPEGKRDGKMRIEGRFQQYGIVNDNLRRYPKSILEREVTKLNSRLVEGIPSSADHPSDGKSRFSNVAAKLEEVKVCEDGWVSGRMVMLNTALGKDAQEVIRSGIKVNVSARGFGTLRKVQEEGSGRDVNEVQDDYELVTYDLVLSDPGFRGANVTSFTEEKVIMKTVEELKAAYPELVAAVEKAAGEKAIAESKEQLTKEITEQLKKDQPDVAKLVEEKVAAEKDAIKAAVWEELKAAGITEAKDLLGKIAEIMAPFMGVKKEEPTEAQAQLEALQAEKAQLVEDKTALEAKIAERKALDELQAAAQALAAHKSKVVEGKDNAAGLLQILETCHTIEEVDAQLPKAVALLESLKPKAAPEPKKEAAPRKGTSAVDDLHEDKQDKEEKPVLTEEQKAQRRAAGLAV